MKTQKRIVCSALFALLSVTNVYGAPEGYGYAEDAPKLSDKMKFGVGFGAGIGSRSSIDKDLILPIYRYGNFFGEYKINNSIGVRLSLQPTRLNILKEEIEGRFEGQVYWKIAPALRVYMGKNKKFCFSLGPQIGYLASAKQKDQDHYSGKKKVLDYFVEKDLEKINMKGHKLNRVAYGFKFSWDYESKGGFIIGVLFGRELPIGNRNTLNEASRSGSSLSNKNLDALWLKGLDLLYLGYNFAKLLD